MLAALRAQHRSQCLRPPSLCRSKSALRGRSFGTSALHPSIHDLASSLRQTQPCFKVSSNRVRVLHQPPDFHDTLLDMIRRARRRIFISSLYIGSGETELAEALHEALRTNPSLHVYLQLDLNRSTRPGPASTITVLSPLLVDFPTRTHISLFRSPKLKGLMAKLVPPRFNEGWGTWHAKIYGADDDVMISGANLNKSYFTNRQDRYIQFTEEPLFADYCFSYLQTAASFSYRLEAPSTPKPSLPTPHWPHSSTRPHRIEREAGLALSRLQQNYISKSFPHPTTTDESDEVFIFPIIQAGQFNIREEEHCLRLLFQSLAYDMQAEKGLSHPVLDLTSGYFGLYQPYQEMILRTPIDAHVICASPQANGFFGSKGISGRIPEAYTLFEQRFMKAVEASGRTWRENTRPQSPGSGVQLLEWQKEGWTYHAKGIWLSPTPSSAPILTLFGSTNLNSRSSNLDTELSFMMLTSSPSLQRQLAQEIQGLREYAGPWKGDARPVSMGTKTIVGLVGGML